jgi:hypothetical protein
MNLMIVFYNMTRSFNPIPLKMHVQVFQSCSNLVVRLHGKLPVLEDFMMCDFVIIKSGWSFTDLDCLEWAQADKGVSNIVRNHLYLPVFGAVRFSSYDDGFLRDGWAVLVSVLSA